MVWVKINTEEIFWIVFFCIETLVSILHHGDKVTFGLCNSVSSTSLWSSLNLLNTFCYFFHVSSLSTPPSSLSSKKSSNSSRNNFAVNVDFSIEAWSDWLDFRFSSASGKTFTQRCFCMFVDSLTSTSAHDNPCWQPQVKLFPYWIKRINEYSMWVRWLRLKIIKRRRGKKNFVYAIRFLSKENDDKRAKTTNRVSHSWKLIESSQNTCPEKFTSSILKFPIFRVLILLNHPFCWGFFITPNKSSRQLCPSVNF